MGNKAERMAYAVIETTLEQIGIVKFAHLFQEVVGDLGSLEDGLDDVSEKRERQFRDGIAKIIKARKGAVRDEREEEEEDCDCCNMPCRCHSIAIPSDLSIMVNPEKRIKETVKDFLVRMQHWTGLHISTAMAQTDTMGLDFNVRKLTKKLRKCQSVSDLAHVLNKKIHGHVTIRESSRGKILPGVIRLTASSSAYVVCLA